MRQVCDKLATIRVTGLIGLPPKMSKRLFSDFTTKELDISRMRFITFELELLGADIAIKIRDIQNLSALGIRTFGLATELKNLIYLKDI